MMKCDCPDEDKDIYNLTDCCKCTYCEIDMSQKTIFCRYCKLIKCSEVPIVLGL